MSDETRRKVENARERLLDAVEDLAALGWKADAILAETHHALSVAVDDGLLESAR